MDNIICNKHTLRTCLTNELNEKKFCAFKAIGLIWKYFVFLFLWHIFFKCCYNMLQTFKHTSIVIYACNHVYVCVCAKENHIPSQPFTNNLPRFLWSVACQRHFIRAINLSGIDVGHFSHTESKKYKKKKLNLFFFILFVYLCL